MTHRSEMTVLPEHLTTEVHEPIIALVLADFKIAHHEGYGGSLHVPEWFVDVWRRTIALAANNELYTFLMAKPFTMPAIVVLRQLLKRFPPEALEAAWRLGGRELVNKMLVDANDVTLDL